MLFFLQVLAYVIVSILLIIVAIYCCWRFSCKQLLALDKLTYAEPLFIHLNEDISPDWQDKKQVKVALDELIALGFQQGKAYDIYELEQYSLMSFFKGPVIAVLYWHDIMGCWVDMLVEDIDGKQYSVSNVEIADTIEVRPELVKRVYPKASVMDIYQHIKTMTSSVQNTLLITNIDEFRPYFETFYKQDMAFKAKKGGLNYDEFLSLVNKASKGKPPSDKQEEGLRERYTEYKEGELDRWHEAAMEEYRIRNNIDSEGFYELEEALIIVPFKVHPEAFVQYLCAHSYITDEQEEKLLKTCNHSSDMGSLFEDITQRLSPDLRPKLLMELEEPLAMHIYKLSEKMIQHY